MQFKTKDLLVTVLPAEIEKKDQACLLQTHICRPPSIIGCICTSVCSTFSCGTTCAVMSALNCIPFVIRSIEDLATLKAELQATLKSLDAIEKGGLPGSIGSKSEAEALERALTAALEEVRAAKKKL